MISCKSAPLGLAPTRRAMTSPFLNSNSVGMLMTENFVAVATFSSTSSLPMENLSACSVANSSRIGAIILQGPHHSAQKSTRIGFSDAPMTSSKVASVRVVMLLAHNYLLGAVSAPGQPLLASGAYIPCASSQRSASIAAMQPEPADGHGLAINVVLDVARGEESRRRS